MSEFDDYETDDEDIEDVPRTAQEIARRALVLSAVVSVAYGFPPEKVLKWLDKEGLTEELSPFELKFLKGNAYEDAKIPISWRSECLVVLLWCICKIDRLPTLTEQFDTEPPKGALVYPPDETRKYTSSARMRDLEEIYDEREVVFDAHWKVRDAQINDKPIPDDLDPEVVFERHYAFNWVIGYAGQDWDDITTDT